MTQHPPGRRVTDISVAVGPGTPEWPGDTPFSCRWTWDMSDDASVNVSAITMSPHVGTHADTPLHVRPGAAASETLPLDAFHGSAVLLDVSDEDGDIALERVVGALDAGGLGGAHIERLLLRTGRSIADGRFPDRWPALTTECASALVDRGLRLLGVDCPSVDDRDSKSLDVHHALLGAGACVLENLDLRGVSPGVYLLEAMPMRVVGLDAAPVRAVLVG